MGFRKLALGMAASLVVLTVGFSGQSKAAGAGFSDFNQNDWGYKEVHYLVDKGVLEGYPGGTFKPDKAIKRKEAATMIGRIFDLNGKKRKTEFPDVDRHDYASGYIQSGADNGYITGYPDHTFRPNQSMQRDEMAYLVSRAFSLKDVNKFLPYTDVIQNKDNYIPINKVTTAGINNGYEDGTFRPDKNISRREFSIMVARAMNSKFRPTQSQSFEFEGVVTASTLNVRQGPSTNYHVVAKLHRGTPVKVSDTVGGWGFVTSGTTKGFVSLKYIHKATENPLEGRVITIDAGHGGSDWGANVKVDGHWVKEKNINLDVSLQVAKNLEAYGAKVVLTRKGNGQLTNGFSLNGDFDKTKGLQTRVDISDKADAEAFVSIHTNACGCSGRGNGTETYYHTYSASAVNEQTLKSEKLATFIDRRMAEMTGMEDRGAKEDTVLYKIGLHVLRENHTASTLVELGFIDNDQDLAKLTSNSWRNTAAKAITLGIQDYFKWLMKQNLD